MKVVLAQMLFAQWALHHQYDISPAVSPSAARAYANLRTQDALEAFNAGARSVARMITESTIETEALTERINSLAGTIDV